MSGCVSFLDMTRGGQRAEQYTPGQAAPAVAMMAARRVETHGRFFLSYLRPGQSLLDTGCGPGAITERLDIASCYALPWPDASAGAASGRAHRGYVAMFAEAWVGAIAIAIAIVIRPT